MNLIKNTVQLIGHVGKQPSVHITSKQKKIASLVMVTSERYYNAGGEKVEEAQWHHLTTQGKNAEFIEKHISKGSYIAIEGKLCHRSFINKEGAKAYITEVVIREIMLLEKGKATEEQMV
jgi:single-strand DNA-binding protein